MPLSQLSSLFRIFGYKFLPALEAHQNDGRAHFILTPLSVAVSVDLIHPVTHLQGSCKLTRSSR